MAAGSILQRQTRSSIGGMSYLTVNNTSTIRVQDVNEDDIPSITAIYATQVLETTNTYEDVPPTEADMKARMEALLAQGFPYLVAKATAPSGTVDVVGYAYASTYRSRAAYRFTVESTVYVHPAHQRRGIGRVLLERLIHACEQRGFRSIVAVMGDTQNAASMGLHTACGFKEVGVLRGVGRKMGQWLDTPIMQRALNPAVDSFKQ